ncbi:gamma-glutamyl-gamma-aminobutyrate hydrolase family protein [Slackia heliotrinireducens]|jgi:putative glutamine amidotransferase|uniref:gamma-glutamyl-gamma-aminobutyrate hydrolase family protein n=1 Tax=Slackia heliotrinireducens TaxID=84110 RepID=UPI003314CEF6
MGEVHDRPIIGIVPTQDLAAGRIEIRDEYLDAIVMAGGTPLVLPLTEDTGVYETLFPLVDGFVLSGGHDIDPARYGGDASSDKLGELTPMRDAVEYLVLSYAYKYDVPTLGICRGMQMMNVFFGGTLYIDLADQFDGPQGITQDMLKHQQTIDYSEPSHFVDIVQSSKLGNLLQTGRITTNSMHHQGVCVLAPLLNPVAFGPDGLVEAIEVKDRSFMMGVQWHPEFFAGAKKMGCIFASLVDEAGLSAIRQQNGRKPLPIVPPEARAGAWPEVGRRSEG